MKRQYAWILIGISFIILYFNTGFYLNTAVSLKYEVDHPRMMKGNDRAIEIRESELRKNYNLSIGIYFICIASIGTSI